MKVSKNFDTSYRFMKSPSSCTVLTASSSSAQSTLSVGTSRRSTTGVKSTPAQSASNSSPSSQTSNSTCSSTWDWNRFLARTASLRSPQSKACKCTTGGFTGKVHLNPSLNSFLNLILHNSPIYDECAKLSPHRFWPCHENGLIKTIQTIPHNLHLSFKFTSLYFGLRIILVYPNPL